MDSTSNSASSAGSIAPRVVFEADDIVLIETAAGSFVGHDCKSGRAIEIAADDDPRVWGCGWRFDANGRVVGEAI